MDLHVPDLTAAAWASIEPEDEIVPVERRFGLPQPKEQRVILRFASDLDVACPRSGKWRVDLWKRLDEKLCKMLASVSYSGLEVTYC